MNSTRLAVGIAGIAAIAGISIGVQAVAPVGHTAGAAALQAERINLVIVPDSLQGSDKHAHDAYVPSSISALVGQQVTVTVYNLDTAPHSFTAPGLALNAIIPAGSHEGAEGVKTFSFTAKKAGSYQWRCILPCDGGGPTAWAMTHNGYMAGTITVK